MDGMGGQVPRWLRAPWCALAASSSPASMRQLRGRPVLALVLSGCVFLTGCSVRVAGEASAPAGISRPKLEAELKRAIKAKAGVTVVTSQCDGALVGEVDATQRCIISTKDGRKYVVEVITSEVDGSDIQFHFRVDPRPLRTA